MKVFITSIGEATTNVCVWQARRLGFLDLVVLDQKESWYQKYIQFLNLAKEYAFCLRIDADIILNKRILNYMWLTEIQSEIDMYQFNLYCQYKNDIIIGPPVFYRRSRIELALDHIKDETFHHNRPETDVWRLAPIHTKTFDEVVGIHGFYQDKETIDRAKKNKENRKQIENYDFELTEQLKKLYE